MVPNKPSRRKFYLLSEFNLYKYWCKCLSLGTTCYTRLEGEEGFLESPDYPSDYPSNQDCNYDIVRTSSSVCGIRLYSELMVTDALMVSLIFVNNYLFLSSVEDLNIPGSITKGGDVCMNDYISVESCVPEGGARFCGNDAGISRKKQNKVENTHVENQFTCCIPQTDHYNFQPGATAIRLLFHSDSSGSGRGFRIKYKMVEDCSSYFYDIQPSGIPPLVGTATCFTRISEPSGTINTPYHPKNYPENLDCVYQFVRYQ